MTEGLSGYEKAKETAKRLKDDAEAKKSADEQGKEKAMSDLDKQAEQRAMSTVQYAGVSMTGALADRFRRNAKLGSENITQLKLPQLKIIDAKTELPEGVKRKLGHYVYVPTGSVFESELVSIMTISRGFYAEGYGTLKKPTFNQIIGGIILSTMQPFVFYCTGLKMENLWNFGKDISPFTNSKSAPIPMYAFVVKMGVSEMKHSNGFSYVQTLDIQREDGHVHLITDEAMLDAIERGLEKMEETIASVIEQKEVDKVTGQLLKDSVTYSRTEHADRPVQEVQPANDTSTEDIVDVSEEIDIPF